MTGQWYVPTIQIGESGYALEGSGRGSVEPKTGRIDEPRKERNVYFSDWFPATLLAVGVDTATAQVVTTRLIQMGEEIRGPDDLHLQP